jgi:exodeoxyribonuclease VII small subunit
MASKSSDAGEPARQQSGRLRPIPADDLNDRANEHAPSAASASEADTASLAALSFEAALEELDRVVAALEDGQPGLDDSLSLYERGMRLAQRCQELLDGAELRVQRLRPAGGDAGAEIGAEREERAYLLEAFEDDQE